MGGVETIFVGSIFEITSGVETRHIFLGDQRIASVNQGRTLYYHADHLGGMNILTDDQGSIKERTEYEPFGQFARHEKYGGEQDVVNFYFTNQYRDKETELYYYGARYYDPSLGRFITPDTIVPYPNNPQALNRYSYAGNNPVSHLEDGHEWFKKFFGQLLGRLFQF